MLPALVILWSLFAGMVVLLLPGIAWFAWFQVTKFDLLEHLAEAIGLSVALTALLALAGFLIGVRFSPALIIALYTLVAAVAVAGLLLQHKLNPQPGKDHKEEKGSIGSDTSPLRFAILLAVPLLILAWRLFQVRDLALPAWVDSVHHVLIVRLMLEKGGLPATLEPYLPVPFYYHFGFHTLAAVYSFWARLAPEQAVLLIGQMLSAAVTFSIYRLGMVLWHDWRRAGLAMALVGFVTQMPAYYVTWGRYTLLLSLVLLPLCMADAMEIMQQKATFPRLARMVFLTAGLLLAHYYAALLLALFLVLLACGALLIDLRRGAALRDSRWMLLAGAAAIGFLMTAPWLFRMWGHAQGWVKVGVLPPSKEAVDAFYFSNYYSYLRRLAGPTRNYVATFLALPGLIMAIWRPGTRLFALWAILLGLFSLPWGVYLTPFRPDHSLIMLFLPVSLFIADFSLTALDGINSGWLSRLVRGGILAVLVALLAWGLWDTRKIVNPSTVIATRADLHAIEWIDSHTPPEARFFINVSLWQYSTYRGVDGGWWIMPLIGRQTLLPPALYSMGDPEYVQRVNNLAEQVSNVKGCSPEFLGLIRESGFDYVYLSQDRGALKPDDLKNCPGLKLIYEEEGVFVYQRGE